MHNYKIISDSACDLPAHLLQELDVTVVPLHVLFRGENQPDSVEDHRSREIYKGLRDGEIATTSAVNPQGWANVMEPILEAGQDVLAIAFSSGLSTTYQSAVIAAGELMAAYPGRKVVVIDSLAAALGQGLLVYLTCKKRDEGLDLEALAAWVEENKLNVRHEFTVNDLMYLKRGGRISATTALVGTMLQIKPLLYMDKEGHLINVGKARGRKGSMDGLVKKMLEYGEGFQNDAVFISHGDCLEEAETVKAAIQEKTGCKNVMIGNLGTVIGSHAGPGTIALFFLGQKR